MGVIFLCWKPASAQFVPKTFEGRVVSLDSAVVVPYANVINRTKHLGTVASSAGYFSLTADPGDEIVISSIGYKEEHILLTHAFLSEFQVIYMTEEIYPLEEVRVFRFNNYRSFKRDFMRDVPALDTTYFNVPPPLEGYSANRPEWGTGITLGNPITALYNLLSREGRSVQKYMAIVNGTDENVMIAQKFNGVVVRSLTGLQGESLVLFITYCNFSRDFLLYASQQEIRRAVLDRYEQFKRGI
jgi:hypothetical protein